MLLCGVTPSTPFMVYVRCLQSTYFAAVVFFFKVFLPDFAVFFIQLSPSFADGVEPASAFFESVSRLERGFSSEHSWRILMMWSALRTLLQEVSTWLIRLPVTPILSPSWRTLNPSFARVSLKDNPNIFLALFLIALLCSIAEM